jgi:hypothetical protein
MKKLVVLTMAVALFIGIPVCVFAQFEPQELRDISKWCKELAAEDPVSYALLFKNLGQCVSSLQACSEYGNTPALCYCRQRRAVDPDGYQVIYETQGLGPCVAHWGALP